MTIARTIGLALITAQIFQCAVCAGETTTVQRVDQDLKGDWLVYGDLVFGSKGEIEPSLRKLTFETNTVVRWYYTIDGHLREHVGRYVIQRAKNTQRQDVVDIAVMTPVTGTPPSSTNKIAFVMQGLTIDYDSRFNVNTIGKVLKFSHRDGLQYVFTRKPKTDS